MGNPSARGCAYGVYQGPSHAKTRRARRNLGRLLKADSPRGVWEISDKGRALLK